MNRVLVAALALVTAAGAPTPPPNVPDRIFSNGRVWTGDPARPRATALAVQGDVLVAVGSDDDILTVMGGRDTFRAPEF